MKEQIIRLSEGCPYSCAFCFNGKKDFKDLPMVTIESNKVIIHDDAFISKPNLMNVIHYLGSQRVNKKVVYYEITQGINKKDLTQEIANELYKNRFKNIRIAWDGSYSKKNMYLVLDAIKMLVKAGYSRKSLMCYILSNYYVSLPENMLKLDLLKVVHMPVCNCPYKSKYLDPKIYYEHWNKNYVEYFREQCRRHGQLIKRGGYDPEIEKRLIRMKRLIPIS